MRVLAVDPGSLTLAAVLFVDGKPKRAVLVPADHPKDQWQQRISQMASGLDEVLDKSSVDLIAIEKVVAHQNLGVAITMAMTVGYLVRTLEVIYPTAFWMEVPKASVCHALGIKGNARRADRQRAAKAVFPWSSQDVCDAAAVGLAALAELKEA